MHKHQIKIDRAAKLATYTPAAEAEIMDSISDTLLERLTAAEIAEVKRCINDQWHKAVAHTERQIVDEGCVWSHRHGQLIELQPVRP